MPLPTNPQLTTSDVDDDRLRKALMIAAQGVSGVYTDNIFRELARHAALALEVQHSFIGILPNGYTDRVNILAGYFNEEFEDGFEYKLDGTPCNNVVNQQFRFYPCDVQQLFPDKHLAALNAESYAALPLFDSQGTAIGLMAVLDGSPLQYPELIEAVLKIFSVRAAVEIERSNADKARRISEDSYRAIFDAYEDAIFIHDMDTGAIVDVNPKACNAYGYSRNEFLTMDVSQLGSGVPPYTMDTVSMFMHKAKNGEPQQVEWHRKNKDGSLRWDEVYIKRAAIGGVDRILAITRDITERKERQDALIKSEDRLRATVEASLDSIIGMDAKGNIIEFNPAAEFCFGYSKQQAIGKSLADLIIPERHRHAHTQGMAHYLNTGDGPYLGKRLEVTALRADGSEFPVELAIDVAQGQGGKIFIGYLRDITERKQAEAERNRLEAQLRQAQKMEAIGHLTGGVAHDFNNILTGVMGYIVMASERVDKSGDEKLQKYLDRSQKAVQRARDLIQQMLTFSRGQRGEPKALSLTPLLKETVKLFESTLPATIEMQTDFASTPAVMVDPVHVEQVLMNLIINARDAMQGRGRLTLNLRQIQCGDCVCTSCRQPVKGDYVELAVIDTGSGITQDIIDRMFEPFFSTKEVGKGSGMGLATVHGILHESKGHIVVDSNPDRGSTFRVLFPPIMAPVDTPDQLQENTTEAEAKPHLLNGRVMLVDDDFTVSEFMHDLLSDWGLDVSLFNNGIDALKHFANDLERFDLVILDQTMPKITGMQTAEQLLKLRPQLPVVLYSGFSEQVTEEKINAMGIRALVKKPIDTQAFFTLLTQLLTNPA
ncbi:PAS domain S-box protein [Kaarinaea lacus]